MSGGELTVAVLGTFQVAVAGRPVEIGSGRLRALLAVLALAAGRSVPVDRVAAAVWDDDLPGDVRGVLRTYLTRLRRALGPAGRLVHTEPEGYRLAADPDHVDALRFARLLRRDDQSTEHARLLEALALWRGTPFEGVRSGWLTRYESPRLVERYLAAIERRADLDLAAGRHNELVPELLDLTERHPLRESLWLRLLAALDHGGRRAEALERYEAIRSRLAEELGSDPGPELRRLHADLLRALPPGLASKPDPVVPRQLPADIDGFAGRAEPLKVLHGWSGEAGRPDATAVVIAAIAGTAGVGKTTLAVHMAHQVADRFPDGQLYVNLRGYHPSGRPMPPAEAIRGFLDAFGVPPQRVPANLDAQVGLYRSVLAGKRVLVLLDNARDAEQVRPLLPGSPTCLVLVTSRDRLTGLVATEAVRLVGLDRMPAAEARELLAGRLGPEPVTAEAGAVDEIVARCAGLPLALAVAAARAASQPGLSLPALAKELRQTQSSLDSLSTGDASTDVRAVLSWSYRVLSPEAARLFRLLGLHPGPELGLAAAASLAGLPAPAVRPLLAELARSNLLAEPLPGRYTLHDLLRAYAAEQAQADEAERRVGIHRLLDHHLHTAYAAVERLHPFREAIALPARQPGVTTDPIGDRDAALAWLTREHAGLLALMEQAAHSGFDDHAYRLARTTATYLLFRGHHRELVRAQHIAIDAARRQGDGVGEAFAMSSLGTAYSSLGQYAEAVSHARQAHDLSVRLGSDLSHATSHMSLGAALARQGCYAEALTHAKRALEVYHAIDDPSGEANAANGAGWCHAQLGEHDDALAYCQRALALHQAGGNRRGEANAWDSLGNIHHQLGNRELAIESYHHAVTLFREVGNRYDEAATLVRLGDMRMSIGDADSGRAAWREALELLEALDHPFADQVREKLNGCTDRVARSGRADR